MGPEAILLSLLQGDSGLEWANRRQGWSAASNDPVCSWYGIICDTQDRQTVTGIFLPQSRLSGTIPSDLGRLTSLRSLTLSQNLIYGTIPPALASLPYLEVLNLADNKITGTIPTFSSGYLHSLILGYNLLTGSIPNNIGHDNIGIAEFDVMHNLISGTIPESFSLMKSLTELSLSNNTISGTIPGSLGEIEVLQYLYLDHNYLVGFIPPKLSRQNSVLEEIWLQNNLLSGTLPAALADLNNLVNLYIDGNKFTGTVPRDLCSSKLNADFFLDVDDSVKRDYCDSVACPVGHVADEGVFPCIPCEDRYYNPYLGRIGHCIDMNQRDILEIFHKSTGGNHWSKSDWEVEDSFLCTFTGVKCDNNNHVISIKLKGMGLIGQIPEEIGFLRYLQELDLSDNELTGYLPSDLRWAPLEFLDVSGNKLRGVIPPTLCLKAGINDNGEGGDYNCENIACPAGTYSSLGRRSSRIHCIPCRNGVGNLGAKGCLSSTGSYAVQTAMSTAEKFFLTMFLLGSLVLLPLCLIGKFGKDRVGAVFGLRVDEIPESDDKDMIEDLYHTVKAQNGISSSVDNHSQKVIRRKTEHLQEEQDSLMYATTDNSKDDNSPDYSDDYDAAAAAGGGPTSHYRPDIDGYSSGGSSHSLNSRQSSQGSHASSSSNGKDKKSRRKTKIIVTDDETQMFSTDSKKMLYAGRLEMEKEDYISQKPPSKQNDLLSDDVPKERSTKELWLDVPSI